MVCARGAVAAERKLPRAIDRFSCLRQKPSRTLANQNANVPPAPIRMRELSLRLSGQRRTLTHIGGGR